MPERTTVTQTTQIGVEATGTPGVAVPANKLLQSISIAPGIEADVDMFRPEGQKFDTVQALNKEWVAAGISGQPTYTELMYLLASALRDPTTTTPAAGVERHVFAPSQSAPDTMRTFTVEQGSSVRAHRFVNGLVTDLGLDISRDGISLSGTMIGKSLEDNVAMTANPTPLALVPVLPTQVSVYFDATSAVLGTTKQSRVLRVGWALGSRSAPLWVLDAAQASFVTTVEGVPDLSATILMEADSQGMGILNRLRGGETRFLRVEAVGPVISGANPYRLRLDMAGKVEDVAPFEDAEGVYAVSWTLAGVHDITWANAVSVELQNALAAL